MDIKGFTYGYNAKRGEYRSEKGIRSQELLYRTGINWLCLAFAMEQEQVFGTKIGFDFGHSCSDRDIMAAVERAHKNEIKVCMKPVLNCQDGVWRAYIRFPEGQMNGKDAYWDRWFESYGNYIKYYAELAEETGCEMFCVGCELCGTEHKEEHWRRLIGEIRQIYSGKLIYNTNHGHEEGIRWFDMMDYIGTSAYFPVEKEAGATAEMMRREWLKVRDEMKRIHGKWKKPIVFAEAGCRSAHGCAAMPWDFTHRELPHDEDEQAAFYESCLSVFSNEPWFGGIFWWDWSTFIYETEEEAEKDNGFNIHLKKAERVIRDWYTGKGSDALT